MAMLAEPRRKVRYIVNPNGKDWVEKESGVEGSRGHFGHRMLRSMGWSEGRGLGKDCQGSAEPIRVRHKTDQRGVGCTSAYAAESTPQSVDFASLLSELNAAHSSSSGENNNTAAAAAAAANGSGNSLEAKSRASRARLHYHRFTRGKDVSAYDSRALACILGSREPPPPQPPRRRESQEEEEKKASEDEQEEERPSFCGFGFSTGGGVGQQQAVLNRSQSEFSLSSAHQQGLQLVQSQTSLQDYFKAKMQARRVQQQQQQQQQKVDDSCEKEGNEDAASSWTSESSCSIASTDCGSGGGGSTSPLPSPPEAKRVRFSLATEPEPNAEPEPEALTIDFGLFPGCGLQWNLGYPLY